MLSKLLFKAVLDLDLQRLLFEDPERAAENHSLTEAEYRVLKDLPRENFQAAIGRLIKHRILSNPVGQKICILPKGANIPENGRTPIFLDQSHTGSSIGSSGIGMTPGKVFGSGTHYTTQLCLNSLEEEIQPGQRVLDLGTGSGVLALASAKLGAASVLALDIDPNAVLIAQQNLLINQYPGFIQINEGSIGWLDDNWTVKFDLIIANILADVHLDHIEKGLLNWLSPGGSIILSGFTMDQLTRVEEGLNLYGWEKKKVFTKGRWAGLSAKKSSPEI